MTVIIFDVDGTLADSFDYVADFLAAEAGMQPLTTKQKEPLRGLSMTSMAKLLGYHWWDGPRLFFKGRRRMQQSVRDWRAFEGMPELIARLNGDGHELYVLSTNSLRNVKYFLQSQRIYQYFVQVYGGVGIFDKAPALRLLVREQNLDLHNAVYVGDELRDVGAAKAVNMRVVAVSWGFASRDHLESAQPTALADTPAELLRILKKL